MTGPVIVGQGPQRVLALPGWFGSSAGWGGLPGLVDGDRYTYAFVDYRGYGSRRGESGEHTIDELAGDALAEVDKLGWDRFAVVGHSMGGSVMQRVMLRADGRVQGMVGISPVPSTGMPFDEQAQQLFVGAAERRENRYAIIDLTTGNRLSRTWLEQMVDFSFAQSDVEAFGAVLTAWAGTNFSGEVTGSSTPVLVLVGEHDPALSAAVMQQTFLQQYAQAQLQVLTNAGHYAMFETPVSLVTAVEQFLDGLAQ